MYLEKHTLEIQDGIIQLPRLYDVENRKLYYFLKEEGSPTLFYSERIDDIPDEEMLAVHSIPVRADNQRRIPLPQELLDLTGATKVTVEGKIVGFELNFELRYPFSPEELDDVHRKLNLK